MFDFYTTSPYFRFSLTSRKLQSANEVEIYINGGTVLYSVAGSCIERVLAMEKQVTAQEGYDFKVSTVP